MSFTGFAWECSCGHTEMREEMPEECFKCGSLDSFMKMPEEILKSREQDLIESDDEMPKAKKAKSTKTKKSGRKK